MRVNLRGQLSADNDVLGGKIPFQDDARPLVVTKLMNQSVPPPPAPTPTPIPPPQGGGSCFAKGCLTLLIAGIAFIGVCIFGGWFILNRLVDKYTGTEPVLIDASQPTAANYQAAESKWKALRAAIQNNQETTVEFTATDFNALIANDPDFRRGRERVRVAIADSIASLDLSVPLDSAKWRHLRGRWFNGNVRFGLSFIDDDFSFTLKSAQANGRRLPSIVFTSDFEQRFNRSFNETFKSSSARHRERNEEFRHIRSISVQDDKVVVTTRRL